MTLRSDALAAHEAQVDKHTADARARLGEVLAPADVSALDVVHTEDGPGWTLAVFTDGDVALSVRLRGDSATVTLAAVEDGRWTYGPAVESLAHLGELLPVHDPADATYPAWVQPTGAHDAYSEADRVTHGGKTWESTVAGNVWEPGVSGWREVA